MDMDMDAGNLQGEHRRRRPGPQHLLLALPDDYQGRGRDQDQNQDQDQDQDQDRDRDRDRDRDHLHQHYYAYSQQRQQYHHNHSYAYDHALALAQAGAAAAAAPPPASAPPPSSPPPPAPPPLPSSPRHAHHHDDQDSYGRQPLSPTARRRRRSSSSASSHLPIPVAYNDRPGQTPVAPSPRPAYAAGTNLPPADAAPSVPAAALGSPLNPDDFYRSYRGVQAAASPSRDAMAAAAPGNWQSPPLRPDGNGTPSKHAAAAASASSSRAGGGARPAPRSASSPLEHRSGGDVSRSRSATDNGPPSRAHTSVKDLKKKFDQTTQQPPSAPRRLTPRNASRDRTATARAPGGAGPSYSTLRTSASRDAGADAATKGGSSRGSQREKFVPEDQTSSNAQSFASRISRPRASISSNSQASKSMTNLGQKASPNPQPSSPPPMPSRSAGLLFGEILPGAASSATAGFGIERVRPRRTSESQLHNPVRQHQRSLSDAVVEPDSPTEWYRGASPPTADGGQMAGSKIPKIHNRSHSDLAGTKPDAGHATSSAYRRIADPQVPPADLSPASRLPLSVKKLNSPTKGGSPNSTRSNSPASTGKRPPGSGRTSRQQGHHSTATGTKASTTRSTTTTTSRAKTSTATRKPPANGTATPSSSSSNRLAAYISAPPPKLSPPLRSSRPRQPVSSATTASSRLRAADTAKSPPKSSTSRPGSRSASRQDAPPATRRRKISVGPVDFAERRETIKLKYSKSIRETEARQVREAAADKRKKELEAAARAKVAAEAKAQAAQAAAAAAAQASAQARERHRAVGESAAASARTTGQASAESTPAPAAPIPPTAASPVAQPGSALGAAPPTDSPTLGIPGSFPSYSPRLDEDEPPPSAVSTTSAGTEFDNEPQTEPPIRKDAVGVPAVAVEPASAQPTRLLPIHEKATYLYPFEEDTSPEESASIQIALDVTSPQEPVLESAAPRELQSGFEAEPRAVYRPQNELAIPGSFGGEYEHHADYEPEHYFEPQPGYDSQSQHDSDHDYQPHSHYEPEPEYEPQPYAVPEYQTTTVTIISRDSGFPQPSRIQNAAEAEPAVGGRDYPKAVGAGPEAAEHHVAPAEVPRDRAPEVDGAKEPRPEDFYVGAPYLRDNIAALRQSTLAPSEADSCDEPAASGEVQHTPDTSNSLTVPSLLSPANRSSQQSVWTDLSIDSNEGHAYSARGSAHSREATHSEPGRSRRLDSRASSLRDDAEYQQFQYSPDPSLFAASRSSSRSRHAAYPHRHQLPELDTGDGFSIAYGDRHSKLPAIPRLPDHEPPPPPDDHYLDESRRTSDFFDDRRPSSSLRREESSYTYVASRRESEDFAPPVSTPQSVEKVSLDVTSLRSPVEHTVPSGEVPDKQPPNEKERSRLTQRQLVIKELVDTEAVFVRDMNVVEEIYKGTAEACPRLDDKTIKLIFRNTDEIIAFHTTFLADLKEGVANVYVPKGRRSPMPKEDTAASDATTPHSMASAVPSTAASSTTAVSVDGASAMTSIEAEDHRDRQTLIGPAFARNIENMKIVHEGFLRTSDHAAKRLIQIQEDPTVQVWLNECNEVAKDLTAAWNLDSLLIKPMQRITKYPNLISQLLQYTPADHPDRDALASARTAVESAILEINKTKKNFELVGQIVGRKRKESDVRAGFARAFGKRVDKLQASSNRPPEDPEYAKLHEKFGDDYLRLQVVLRDVEFYTRQVSTYVHEFLQYLSSMELVMRLQPGPYPEIESKWVQFNVSMRDIEKVALEQHLTQVRKHVIEPFELVIKCYGNPSLAMKKRAKRRVDYEKSVQLKKGGKKVEKQLAELVEQYEALNETLKKELPKLSALTETIGNICLGNFVDIQAKWYSIWKDKVKVVLGDAPVPELADIVRTFHGDFRDVEEQISTVGIVNPLNSKVRTSQSTTDEPAARVRSRPAELARSRGLSVNSATPPVLPTPDFAKRNSGQFTLSPTVPPSSPFQYTYRDYYAGINGHARGGSSPITPDPAAGSRPSAPGPGRPGTGRSYDSSGPPRPSISTESGATRPSISTEPGAPRPSVSTESGAPSIPAHSRRDSNSTFASTQPAHEGRRFSGLFHSALPLEDNIEAQRSSRASSRERAPINGYNVLWLAASLFEFNIETTKHEAGYPYLTYQAGEIFDVIAEKGELWLAKNQDDPSDMVGWIWSKHFAKLADS